MNLLILKRTAFLAGVGALSLVQCVAGQRVSKTLRVDHGHPVIVVSQKSVLLLEFVKEPYADANVSYAETNILHVRAGYRFRVFDGDSGAVTNGEGSLQELYEIVSQSKTNRNLKDIGSQTRIIAGEFNLGWSQGKAGASSWLYYRADSEIRFVQQPQAVAFETVDTQQFRRYLGSRNVQEFVAAGKTVQVMGPAVFSGELPTDQPVSGRIESGSVHDGMFELKLSNLATNKHYIIESSYELGAGAWNVVHTFTARETGQAWSDPLGKDVNMVFYRIREGTY